jgi:hypothetical protein
MHQSTDGLINHFMEAKTLVLLHSGNYQINCIDILKLTASTTKSTLPEDSNTVTVKTDQKVNGIELI